MAAILKVSQIQDPDGNIILDTSQKYRPGEIIEMITSPCDGSSVVGTSGTFTFGNVTAKQVLSDTYADVTGSLFTYTPPPEAARVVYEFIPACGGAACSGQSIGHFRFYLDGVEVTSARFSHSGYYGDVHPQLKWVFNIGGVADPTVGRLNSWTTPKQIKVQSRRYGASNFYDLHATRHWDGATNEIVVRPTLTITAIA